MAKGRDAEPVKGRTARPAGKARGRRGEDPDAARVLQKRQFVSHVAARAGMRSAQVKDIVEATLAELGEAKPRGRPWPCRPWGALASTGSATCRGPRSSSCVCAAANATWPKALRTTTIRGFSLLQPVRAAAI